MNSESNHPHMAGYLFIIGTVLLTVYGQVVFKWQVDKIQVSTASGLNAQVEFVVRLLLNPWIVSSLAAAFLASLSWAGALRYFELSYAYPFTSLSFVLVMGLGIWLFKETFSFAKLTGVGLIVLGLIIASRG